MFSLVLNVKSWFCLIAFFVLHSKHFVFVLHDLLLHHTHLSSFSSLVSIIFNFRWLILIFQLLILQYSRLNTLRWPETTYHLICHNILSLINCSLRSQSEFYLIILAFYQLITIFLMQLNFRGYPCFLLFLCSNRCQLTHWIAILGLKICGLRR